MYLHDKRSAAEIGKVLGCSEHKVNYWLSKYDIQKRGISSALYERRNPNGDPFSIYHPRTVEEAIMYGMGIGLYWGEGTKSNKTSVRLGNTDPGLIKKFIEFLKVFYRVDPKKIRFGLQVFGDMDADSAVDFWIKELGVSREQFMKKIIVTPHRGVGNYRKKTKYGVLTVYFNNTKLRDIICSTIDTYRRVDEE